MQDLLIAQALISRSYKQPLLGVARGLRSHEHDQMVGERYLPWVVRKDPSRSASAPGVAGTRAGETVGNEPNPGFPGIPGAGKGFG